MSKKTACVPEGTHTYLECEKTWVFALLMAVGGYLGAFTYVRRGGIFCNAQTGNLVLLGLAVMYLNGEVALTAHKKKAVKHEGEH